MVASFRERLARKEKEVQRILLENKRISTDKFQVQRVFKDCLDQLKADRKTYQERALYGNQALFSGETTRADATVTSMLSGGG